LFVQHDEQAPVETPMTRAASQTRWHAEAPASEGDLYWFVVDGAGPLLDPECADLVMTLAGPRSVVRHRWPQQPPLPRTGRAPVPFPVVYEVHVRGFGRTFAGCAGRLDHLAALGVDAVELMPVHPFDSSDNYWGYMPLVWGAVHRPYAASDDPPGELARFVAAAHERGIEVWLDMVFNHTGEGDATKPTWSLRALDDAHAYLHLPDGSYNDDAGCGNVVNPADGYIRHLVMAALDRFADLGVDGFRFDLASLLTRDGGGLVERITAWAARRQVRLIAEPWDLAAYQVGQWPQPWLQWNDQFRDQVRGFLRAEPGLVAPLMQRLQGSPDLFAGQADASVNFVTAHDGLTMHDLTVVTSDRHHSWDCGDALRMQQLKNYFTLLLLSRGAVMFVMGDEFARTQDGLDNPYDVDSEVTWVDWSRLEQWRELFDYVQMLIALRRVHTPGGFRFHGLDGPADTSLESRALAWATGGLYVLVNAHWDPAPFRFQEPGQWELVTATAPLRGSLLAPRSIAIYRSAASVAVTTSAGG
jgi:glycogen operon protein